MGNSSTKVSAATSLGLSKDEARALATAFAAVGSSSSSVSSWAAAALGSTRAGDVFTSLVTAASSSSSDNTVSLEGFATAIALWLGKSATGSTVFTVVLLKVLTAYVAHQRDSAGRLLPPESPGPDHYASAEDIALLLRLVVEDGLGLVAPALFQGDGSPVPALAPVLDSYTASLAAVARAEALKSSSRHSPKSIVAHTLASYLPGLVPNMLAGLMRALATSADVPVSVFSLGSRTAAAGGSTDLPTASNTVVTLADALPMGSLSALGVDLGPLPEFTFALVVLAGRPAFAAAPTDAAAASASAPAPSAVDDDVEAVLFDSTQHGAALSALCAHVTMYSGASLVLMEGPGVTLGALVPGGWPGAATNPWTTEFFGSSSSVIFALAPEPIVLPASARRNHYMYAYSSQMAGGSKPTTSVSKTVVDGVGWGGRVGSFRLHLSDDLARVHARSVGTTYAPGALVSADASESGSESAEFAGDVHRVVVVGLGGAAAAAAHDKALDRVRTLVEHRRSVDRSAMSESTDRMILDLAGVHDSQYRDRVENEARGEAAHSEPEPAADHA